MKYGLVYYKYTDNLGDDILSYAASRFLPQIDYYIDREALDTFVPNECEPVAVILNGWFLHRSYAFPPSPYLYPLFTGIHFSTDHIAYGDYSWLDGFTANYLKSYGPIGCRDTNTLTAMKQRDIPAFFSGCLTMTLEPFPNIRKNNTILLTDVSSAVEIYIRNHFPEQEILTKTHTLNDTQKNKDWDLRKQRVEDYLKLYQSAKLVITTRLHCALPAMAMGTPVILIGNSSEDFQDRIGDYTRYCNCFSEENLLSHEADQLIQLACDDPNMFHAHIPKKVNESSLQLPLDKSVLRQELIHCCSQFIQYSSSLKLTLPPVETYQTLYIDRTKFLKKCVEQLAHRYAILQITYQQEHKRYQELSTLSQQLMTEYQRLLQQ